MIFPFKIGLVILSLGLVLAYSYEQGRRSGRVEALKIAVGAYQTREKINYETNNLEPHALCLSLGGMQHECGALMRGVGTVP